MCVSDDGKQFTIYDRFMEEIHGSNRFTRCVIECDWLISKFSAVSYGKWIWTDYGSNLGVFVFSSDPKTSIAQMIMGN